MNSIDGKSIFKIKKKSVVKQVSDVLRSKIFSSEWPAGHKIPSEQELCEILDVSRVSVRAAIQELIGLGLIESRHGEGTFVKKFSLRAYFEQVSPLIFRQDNHTETVQYRFAIESACAILAIDNYCPAEIDKLDKLCDVSEMAYSQERYKEYVELDYDFHKQLCSMANNEIFLIMFEAFSISFFSTMTKSLEKVRDVFHAEDLSHHKNLVAAIRAKDKERAYLLCQAICYL